MPVPTTTQPTPTVQPSGSAIPGTALYILKTATTKGDFIGGNGGPIDWNPNPVAGYYLENTSDKNIISVNVTIINGFDRAGVWLYTVDTGGSATSWDTKYQTTPITGPGGGYTGTYTIQCNIAPGGAFVVNTSQTTDGSIKFNSVVNSAVTIPPIQKKNYIRSSDGNYLILENNYKISSTPDYTHATPIVLGTLKYNNQQFYTLMTESGKYISMTNNNVNYTSVPGNDINNATSLVLISKTYPTDLYLWGTNSYSIQPSLVVGKDPNKAFSVVYV
jgi:hypothetical protein